MIHCQKDFNAPYLSTELKDLEGKKHKIIDYKGKVLILDFWASWCEPCKKAVPVIELLRENASSEDFVFIAVNTDNDLTEIEIRKVANQFGIKYQILLDPDLELARQLNVEGLPGLFVFDKAGQNIYHQYGVNPEDAHDLLKKMSEWQK